MKLVTRKTATALITSLLLIPMSCEEGDLDQSAENPEEDGVETEDATENTDESQREDESITLAEINLSDTHKITLAIESDDEYSLTETLNVDLDGDRPSYATLDSEGMSLSEVYDHLAGEQWNAKTRRVFASADDAIFEDSLKLPVDDFNPDRIEELMIDESELLLDDEREETLADKELTARSICTTPDWDWYGDDGWFKDNYCFNDSKFCGTSGVGQRYRAFTYGYYTTTMMKATGFAQAFCNQARYRFWVKTYGGFPSYGITVETKKDVIVEPRYLYTHARTNKKNVSYKAKIEHYSGSEPERVGLSIHRN